MDFITAPPPAIATRVNPVDGAEYVYVPAGPFIMGADDDDVSASADEKLQHTGPDLGAFWIMRTEVTNAQYARCVAEDACTAPNNTRWNAPGYESHLITPTDVQTQP